MKLQSLPSEWSEAAKESDLGLWWLADDIRECLGSSATEAEVKRTTLSLLRPLLESHRLRAVDLLHGGKFVEWSGDPESHLKKISHEWDRLTEPPSIGDIVWFIGDRPGEDKLNLLKERLDLFRRKKIHLYTFIQDLDFLISSMSSEKDDLKRLLFEEWEKLEVLIAILLAELEGRKDLAKKLDEELGKPKRKKTIDEAVENIARLLEAES